MIEPGIYALLAGNSALASLVGPRIFAGDAPPDNSQLPCVTYTLVGGGSGPTMNTTGMIDQRVELNGHAIQAIGSSTPKAVAAQIRAAIIAAIAGWQQLLQDGTNVSGADLVNPGTDFVSEQRIFRAMCEFRVHYTLPVS